MGMVEIRYYFKCTGCDSSLEAEMSYDDTFLISPCKNCGFSWDKKVEEFKAVIQEKLEEIDSM